ncbi:MAG: pancreas/duodenum homeobox protein 1 [Deltaproteobacteria bacterium]|nr:pancreas/duodenum homeobox protein 1 [Deltaproteobacteria bacterium]MBW2642450.1 pancreas/duodenum homeobox protein 1 [Deltaproteobacteria bacterium]
MGTKGFDKLFTPDVLKQLFSEERSDQFFEALYGDAEEGAYDISLEFIGFREKRLEFMLRLTQRAGKCITCSLTYGLPEVFTRHPIINIKGLVQNIEALLDGRGRRCADWHLGSTQEVSNNLHTIPLSISLKG